MSFQVDVWAGSQLSMTSINPSGPGIARVSLGFALEESNDNLVEIRVMNERAAIYGRVGLGQATVTLLQSVPPTMIDTLTTELGIAPDGGIRRP